MAEQHQNPKHINEALAENITGDQRDYERSDAVRRRDLQSEIAGLTEGIAEIEEDMQRTSDPALKDELDDATHATLDAQQELRTNNETDDNQ